MPGHILIQQKRCAKINVPSSFWTSPAPPPPFFWGGGGYKWMDYRCFLAETVAELHPQLSAVPRFGLPSFGVFSCSR